MKKLLILMAALGLVLSSCSNETPLGPEPVVQGEAALSFKITKPSSPYVTRADIATEYEWNIASFDVYSAVDEIVTKLTKDVDYKLTPDALNTSNRTYTITMQTGWLTANKGKTVNFYFVGNDATSTKGPHTSLSSLTAESAFKSALTNSLANGGLLDPIVKPNGSTQNLLFSSVVEGVVVTGKVEETGTLQRREARFDLKNVNKDNGENTFVVTRIYVINVPSAGLVFPTGDATTPVDHTLAYPALLNGVGLTAADYTLDAPGSTAGAKDLAPAVFYLYPTKMSPADEDTKIMIMGTVNGGPERAYPVNVAAETAINANFRYVISVDPIKGSFIDSVDDMTDWGTDLSAEPGSDVNPAAATITTDATAIAGGTFEPLGKSFSSFGQAESTLGIQAVSAYGVDWTVNYREGGGLVVTEEAPTVSNTRALSVVNNIKITIPAGAGSIDADVVINDGVAPQTIHVLRIWGGDDAHILYFNGDQLATGKWGTEIMNTNQMALFKFGSVVGIDCEDVTGTDDGFDPTDVKWNPSTATINAWGDIPSYSSDDYNNNLRNVSAPEYMTLANVKAGKGDPCMLVGYTADQIKGWDQAAFDAAMAAAQWRLPTMRENANFIGGDDVPYAGTKPGLFWKDWRMGNVGYQYKRTGSTHNGWGETYPLGVAPNNTVTYAYWAWGDSSATNPPTVSLPVVAQGSIAKGAYVLRTFKSRIANDAYAISQYYGINHWSSLTLDATSGHSISISDALAYVIGNSPYDSGFGIRCVAR